MKKIILVLVAVLFIASTAEAKDIHTMYNPEHAIELTDEQYNLLQVGCRAAMSRMNKDLPVSDMTFRKGLSDAGMNVKSYDEFCSDMSAVIASAVLNIFNRGSDTQKEVLQQLCITPNDISLQKIAFITGHRMLMAAFLATEKGGPFAFAYISKGINMFVAESLSLYCKLKNEMDYYINKEIQGGY